MEIQSAIYQVELSNTLTASERKLIFIHME